MNEKMPEPSAGEKKIAEYADRILAGEAKESVYDGLPDVFKVGIEAALKEKESYRILDEAAQIEDLRATIADPESARLPRDPHEHFSVSNGETDAGFFWYQYRNKEAKRLKESGDFEWGKERIYFDVPFSDMEKLRDVAIRVAGERKIALAFKYIDVEKTFDSQKDGLETRFVANFASREDAQRFFGALYETPEYKSIVPDRSIGYNGIRIDEVAEYASGFREKRGALERIALGAHLNPQSGEYEFVSDSGRMISISRAEYEKFRLEYEENCKLMEETEREWREVVGAK